MTKTGTTIATTSSGRHFDEDGTGRMQARWQHYVHLVEAGELRLRAGVGDRDALTADLAAHILFIRTIPKAGGI